MEELQYLDEEFHENTFKSFNEMFFHPEIERRKASGKWKDNDHLVAAQVLFFPSGQTLIRLNEEVSASVKVKKGIAIEDPHFNPSRMEVESVTLSEDEFKDCGHATMLLFKDGYQLTFDFNYNQRTSKEYLEIAEEFLETARYGLTKNYLLSAIDNAYTSMEFLAKVSMLLTANEEIKKITKHNGIVSAFNARFRNITDSTELRRKEILQLLFDSRNAKYGQKTSKVNLEELTIILGDIDQTFQEMLKRIK